MQTEHQARWISKKHREELRKARVSDKGLVLDSFNGFLMIEPVGSDLGDGKILSREEADYELSPVWCSGPKAKLQAARKLLGLETETLAEDRSPVHAAT